MISQLLGIITVQQNKLTNDTNSQPDSTIRHDLTNHLEDLIPNTLMFGPKISWADQTIATNPDEEESGTRFRSPTATKTNNEADNSHHNHRNHFDFNSCSPLKTPSRKPSVLRQIVHDSRSSYGHNNDTTFNTTMNTGPVRNIVNVAEYKQNETITFASTTPLDSTYVKAPEEEIEGGDERRKTFILSTPHNKLQHSIIGPDTPPSGDFARSQIPVRTPLKEDIGNSQNILRIPVFKKPRMRSFTEGDSTLKGDTTSSAKVNKNSSKHGGFGGDRTFVIPKLRKKHHHADVGMPMRSVSTMDLHQHAKENVKPKSKSRSLRASQSLVSLATVGGGSEHAQEKPKKTKKRFRF